MPVEYFVHNGVARVELNQPERLNALNPPFVDELCSALGRAIADAVRVLVLSGRGRAFCAGHDLKHEDTATSEHAVRRDVERLQDVTRLIRRAPFPVIAMVHGYAVGAGCELALCSDHVVAADDAIFAFPEVSVGLSITGGISHILPLAVGLAKAKELVLLGARFTAADALRMGLVNAVVPRADLEHATLEVAAALVAQPPGALSVAKFVLDRGAQSDLSSALDLEALYAIATRGSTEAVRAAASFLRDHARS